MRFSPFSAYGGGQPGTLAGYSWLCFLPLAARRFDQLSPWVTIAPLWLSFRQSSLHPRTQFLSQSLSRHLLIGGLAPFPTCFGHCSWFPSQFSRMITGLCVSPDALLSAHFCSARAAFLRLTGAPSIRPCHKVLRDLCIDDRYYEAAWKSDCTAHSVAEHRSAPDRLAVLPNLPVLSSRPSAWPSRFSPGRFHADHPRFRIQRWPCLEVPG